MSTAYTVLKEVQGLGLRRDTAGVDLIIFDSLGKLEQKAPFLAGEIRRLEGKHGSFARVAVHSLRPGGKVEPHTDELDGEYIRIHLPLNAPVYWWDEEGGDRILEQGVWSDSVPYNVLHSVHNPTDVDRVTVIVDFDPGSEYAD